MQPSNRGVLTVALRAGIVGSEKQVGLHHVCSGPAAQGSGSSKLLACARRKDSARTGRLLCAQH
eukprot:1261373-Rhodomonas_salina.1